MRILPVASIGIAGIGLLCSPTAVRAGITASPTPYGTGNPYPIQGSAPSFCTQLKKLTPGNPTPPASIEFEGAARESAVVSEYRFSFGDGTTKASSTPRISHTYTTAGTFTAQLEVRDERGTWHTSPACSTEVMIEPLPVQSHQSGCSDIFVSPQDATAPATVSVRVTGYDNTGTLQAYRVDFGESTTLENTTGTFSHTYESAGTFTVTAAVKDSRGNWQTGSTKGGGEPCSTTVRVTGAALTEQPKTGTPTPVLMSGFTAGILGVALLISRRQLAHARSW